MNNKPIALTNEELKEIADFEAIREMWGAESAEEMLEVLAQACYCVRFEFASGGPGWYAGDLFLIHSDRLGSIPVSLTRGPDGHLQVVDPNPPRNEVAWKLDGPQCAARPSFIG